MDNAHGNKNKSLSSPLKSKSSLRLKPKTPLEKQQIIKVNTILTHLLNHPEAVDFKEPVDWQAMELLDYPQIIQNPIDLGTISEKLKDKKYKTVEAVLNDIQLVWDNCKLYNPNTSDIYAMSDKLEGIFRKMIRNYLPQLKVSVITSAPQRPLHQKPFTIIYQPIRDGQQQQLHEKNKARQKEKKQFKKSQSSSLSNKQGSIHAEKKDFVQKLTVLSIDDLEKILCTIQEECPTAFHELEDDYAQLNVEEMNEDFFMKANTIVDELLSHKDFSNSEKEKRKSIK